jgi:arginase
VSAAWTLFGAPLDSSGAGRGEERAPAALRDAGLAERLALRDEGDVVQPLRDPVRDPQTGVIAAAQLAAASLLLRDAVAAGLGRGAHAFVLGGDCCILPGALAGARVARGPIALWMVDGHPDAMDGATSPTGEAADMDLAIVTGRGTPALTGLAGGDGPIVEPRRVALIGHRPASLDPGVAADVAQIPAGVVQITALEARARGASAVARATVEYAGAVPAWLHLDLDALDGEALPAVTYPQPQGLRWDEFIELARVLLAAPNLVGVSLADFEPDRDPTHEHARRVVDALADAWPAL